MVAQSQGRDETPHHRGRAWCMSLTGIAAALVALVTIKSSLLDLLRLPVKPELVQFEPIASASGVSNYMVVIKNPADTELLVTAAELEPPSSSQAFPINNAKRAESATQRAGPLDSQGMYQVSTGCSAKKRIVRFVPPYRISPTSSAAFIVRVGDAKAAPEASCLATISFLTDLGRTNERSIAAGVPAR